jgi:hypothetical protein
MNVTEIERDVVGQPLEPIDRLVAGLVVAVAAVGHALLGAVVLTLLYALLVVA